MQATISWSPVHTGFFFFFISQFVCVSTCKSTEMPKADAHHGDDCSRCVAADTTCKKYQVLIDHVYFKQNTLRGHIVFLWTSINYQKLLEIEKEIVRKVARGDKPS